MQNSHFSHIYQAECAAELHRFEGKYLVSEAVASSIRDFIRPLLGPDEHMPSGSPLGYRVLSLYLDSPQLSLCTQTREGVRQRFKLRLRFYDEDPQSIVSVEVKSRIGDAIHKQRAAVSKDSAASFLQGRPMMAADLLTPSSRSTKALVQFVNHCQNLRVEPIAFVCYWREAYTSRWPNDVRLTIDRGLTARDARGALDLRLPDQEAPAAESLVVLELKYSGRQPLWMQDLVRVFQLQRCSFPKYVRCVDALGIVPRGFPPAMNFSPWGGSHVGMA